MHFFLRASFEHFLGVTKRVGILAAFEPLMVRLLLIIPVRFGGHTQFERVLCWDRQLLQVWRYSLGCFWDNQDDQSRSPYDCHGSHPHRYVFGQQAHWSALSVMLSCFEKCLRSRRSLFRTCLFDFPCVQLRGHRPWPCSRLYYKRAFLWPSHFVCSTCRCKGPPSPILRFAKNTGYPSRMGMFAVFSFVQLRRRDLTKQATCCMFR